MGYFATLGLGIFLYATGWYILSLIKKRNDIADEAWGLGFVLIAWLSLFLSPQYDWRGLLVAILVTIWGGRLFWHINARHLGKPEDYRYLTWRNQWGKWFYIRSYFQVFLFQGLLTLIIAAPVILINKSGGGTLSALDLLGLAVWIVGFAFESIGDAQLARFVKNPANKGKIIQSGLWKYSRHPNYFGEITQWWGIWLIALSVPNGLVSIIGPVTITCLILFVSGIPLLEKKMSENTTFAEYKARTSMIFPLPPIRK